MVRKERARLTMEALEGLFPDARAELDYTNPYELLVATILSAQCTDVRVNQVTKVLFKEAPDPYALAELPLESLEALVKTCGMYRQKAKNLKATALELIHEHAGQVPRERSAIERLPGVGRKTANVVLSNAYDVPAIAVDTHVFRVSHRLDLSRKATPEKVEKDLMKIFPKERWTKLHHQLIFLGRRICKARKPLCEECALESFCPKRGVR